MTSVGGTTYTYDNNGNVTAIGSLDYTWDWRAWRAPKEAVAGHCFLSATMARKIASLWRSPGDEPRPDSRARPSAGRRFELLPEHLRLEFPPLFLLAE